MAYVVYEKNSTKRIDGLEGGNRDVYSYSTMQAAKAAKTRFLKKQSKFTEGDIAIEEASHFYSAVEKELEVDNLMSKKPVKIKANTPWCCNPSSETYWSM